MNPKIAIAVTALIDFSPAGAIRGDVESLGSDFAVKNPTFPPTIPLPSNSGKYLGRDSNSNWHLRPTVQGQDERFTVSSNGYLVCAHRGSAPAFVDCPVQQWSE